MLSLSVHFNILTFSSSHLLIRLLYELITIILLFISSLVISLKSIILVFFITFGDIFPFHYMGIAHTTYLHVSIYFLPLYILAYIFLQITSAQTPQTYMIFTYSPIRLSTLSSLHSYVHPTPTSPSLIKTAPRWFKPWRGFITTPDPQPTIQPWKLQPLMTSTWPPFVATPTHRYGYGRSMTQIHRTCQLKSPTSWITARFSAGFATSAWPS